MVICKTIIYNNYIIVFKPKIIFITYNLINTIYLNSSLPMFEDKNRCERIQWSQNGTANVSNNHEMKNTIASTLLQQKLTQEVVNFIFSYN